MKKKLTDEEIKRLREKHEGSVILTDARDVIAYLDSAWSHAKAEGVGWSAEEHHKMKIQALKELEEKGYFIAYPV